MIKADGLAAGKGVVIAGDEPEARAALEEMLDEQRFGEVPVVVEEFLEGVELSLLALCDGENAVPLAPARDFKRIGEGDTGPNTGGMGAYSPVEGVDDALVEDMRVRVLQPVVEELARRGTPFHGVLYAGLMLTDDGPKVLEFNVRFGDPGDAGRARAAEADLLDLFERATQPGGLAGVDAGVGRAPAVTVVLASRGYPASSSSGDVITGSTARREVLHAGTAERDGAIVTDGGRVLNAIGAGRRPRSRPRGRVCCRRRDHLRRQDLPPGHRRMSEPATETAVETELEGLEVDAPRVGIVMGSKSDMPAMEKAAKELTERGILHEVRVMSAHRDPELVAEYAKNARMRGLRVIIAGAGPVRRAAGRVRRAHRPAGDRRAADVARRPSPAGWTRCSRSPRCHRACRWRAWAWTTPATRRCWPRASWSS